MSGPSVLVMRSVQSNECGRIVLPSGLSLQDQQSPRTKRRLRSECALAFDTLASIAGRGLTMCWQGVAEGPSIRACQTVHIRNCLHSSLRERIRLGGALIMLLLAAEGRYNVAEIY